MAMNRGAASGTGSSATVTWDFSGLSEAKADGLAAPVEPDEPQAAARMPISATTADSAIRRTRRDVTGAPCPKSRARPNAGARHRNGCGKATARRKPASYFPHEPDKHPFNEDNAARPLLLSSSPLCH